METKIIWFGVILGLLTIFLRLFRPRIKSKKSEKFFSQVLDWIDTLFSAVILAALIMNFIIQAFKIPSGSMRPTLIEGDHLFVNKFIYGLRIPFTEIRIFPLQKVKRGEIIIFSCPPEALSPLEREKKVQKDFIKRCIG
ncbi:MAG TPA: signal peptidase I, partial [Elusimicrobia bacterium]|nr:signal peptidase I [Elusimicrobiota bacterium]